MRWHRSEHETALPVVPPTFPAWCDARHHVKFCMSVEKSSGSESGRANDGRQEPSPSARREVLGIGIDLRLLQGLLELHLRIPSPTSSLARSLTVNEALKPKSRKK